MTACEARPSLPDVEPVCSRVGHRHWERTYRRRLVLVDGSVGLLAALAGWLADPGRLAWDWTVLAYVALPVGWVAALAVAGGYDLRQLGAAGDDWRIVATSCGIVVAVVASLGWGAQSPVRPGSVLLPLAVAGALTLTGRTVAGRALRSRRERGQCVQRVLAVGPEPAVRAFVAHLARDRPPAAAVVACCLSDAPRPDAPGTAPGMVGGAMPVPVLGGIADVATAVDVADADAVAVLPCPELEGSALRRLAWAVEDRARYLVVVPGLTDVGPPRLRIGAVGGFAALDVRRSRSGAAGLAVKDLLDRTFALVALILLAPVLIGIAAMVRATSPGPALFRQTRVGIGGREFTFLKFRTMHVGAEGRRHEFAAGNINGDGPLFKLRVDPRVTAVGEFLRRWSLDELPQLLNVLMGHMSLVGPRPPLPHEAARYSEDVRRRFLVRPGMTGLWQVSGRSDLPWDDAVRLDLRYVDNWSLGLDVAILLRTLPAVLHRAGAY